MGPATIVLLVFLLIVFGRSFFKIKNSANGLLPAGRLSPGPIMVLSATVSFVLYTIFFLLSGWIWSFHHYIPAVEFTTCARGYIAEYDGIESFIMYLLMFANLGLTILIVWFLTRRRLHLTVELAIIGIAAVLAGCYFYSIGFVPPMQSIDTTSIMVPAFVTIGSTGLYLLYQKKRMLSVIIVVALMFFAGFITIAMYSGHDLTYILDPALRLKHGYKFSEIYFQYDIFLSLLAILWIKVSTGTEWFAYIAQVSYFLLFITLFFTTDKLFKSRGLSVLFVIALMIVRFYAASGQSLFQVSPLRLDLWVILLLLICKKGAHHWSLGLALGLLVVFHRNLGIIYMVGYLQLLATLFLIDVYALKHEKGVTKALLSALFLNHIKASWKNLSLLVMSLAICFTVFHELFSPGILAYRKFGVGMQTVSGSSFYWYVPVLLSSLFVFLLFYRYKFGMGYTTMGLFVVLLTIGNSLYFFGRSHENNILNISAVLLLSLFLFFDVLMYLFDGESHGVKREGGGGVRSLYSHRYAVLPVLFLFLVSCYYAKYIKDNIAIQYASLLKKQVVVPLPRDPGNGGDVKKATHGSGKVFFLDFDSDFHYYYYYGYAPVGYYSPCAGWLFKKDFIGFLQGLLDTGYYIVYMAPKEDQFTEYVVLLKYDRTQQEGRVVALSKDIAGISSASLPAK